MVGFRTELLQRKVLKSTFEHISLVGKEFRGLDFKIENNRVVREILGLRSAIRHQK